MFMSSNPLLRQQQMPTLAATDAAIDASVAAGRKTMDANDFLYQVEASRDYDPAPGLARIKAPLLAINSADDLINPPELGILEAGIQQVARGRALVIPLSPATRGHGSHTVAALWQDELAALLRQSQR
jgi:homoserine O-acetyltransferase